ncbi:multidrug effflux MFS transporter [Nocardioides mangrovi]|uniref:Multidrug effflux MFS transporter n=1 Tax=Nocardioides mangrovi TaxID=2874580 RepID=A0ABS7U712_9ACTN|nr:multidrug effflux MFS transporter [Nocardioides mangrovi]MBZ5736528.1 multidrug effflux MFS transporter [Nocardioides mangrovi]
MTTSIERARRTPTRLHFPSLVLVVGVGPLATDAYLAALPQVQHQLHTSGTLAQLTMTTFIVGMAAGQLVFGPVSDGVGRRRILVVSSAVFALSSLGCAVSPSIWALLGCRVVQGAAAGCGVALGRAVISDRYAGVEAARRFGMLTSIVLLGPVVAPAVGSVILAFGGWRDVFAALTVVGILMWVGMVLGLPETLAPEARHAHGLRHSLVRMREMLRNRLFLGVVAVQCFATAGFFVYIGGSSIVLQDQLGIGTTAYAVLFATNAALMAVGSLVFRYSVARVGPVPLRRAGLAISTGAVVGLLAYALIAGDDVRLAPTWVLLAVMVGGNGLTIPATTTLAQEIGRRAGGTASALQGGLTFVAGSLALPLTGVVGHQTVLAMALLSSALYVAAGLTLAGVRRGERAAHVG